MVQLKANQAQQAMGKGQKDKESAEEPEAKDDPGEESTADAAAKKTRNFSCASPKTKPAADDGEPAATTTTAVPEGDAEESVEASPAKKSRIMACAALKKKRPADEEAEGEETKTEGEKSDKDTGSADEHEAEEEHWPDGGGATGEEEEPEDLEEGGVKKKSEELDAELEGNQEDDGDKLVSLQTIIDSTNSQLELREGTVAILILMLNIMLIVGVIYQQLDSELLYFSTETVLGSVVKQGGYGSGKDTVSLPTVHTETALFQWLGGVLVPMLLNQDWFGSNFELAHGVREDCRGPISRGEPCRGSVRPEYSEASQKYELPFEDQILLRKFNFLMVGARIRQFRVAPHQCKKKHYTSSQYFKALELTGPAPAFKCYKQEPTLVATADQEHDMLYPRGVASHIANFSVQFGADGFLDPTQPLSLAATDFAKYFAPSKIRMLAKTLLTQCFERADAAMSAHPSFTAQDLFLLISDRSSEFYCRCAEANGTFAANLSATHAIVPVVNGSVSAADLATTVYNASVSGALGQVDVQDVRRECLEATVEAQRRFLQQTFVRVEGSPYEVILAPTLSYEDNVGSLQDVLRFLEAHQWVDEMTRSVVVSFCFYNPSTLTFINMNIQCEFDVAGSISCSPQTDVLRMGSSLYNNFNIWGVFRAVCGAGPHNMDYRPKR